MNHPVDQTYKKTTYKKIHLKMSTDNINIQNVYDEVVRNRSEIRSFIEASESRLLLKIEEANQKILNLENENHHLKKQIEYLDRENRRNNLAIFGLNKPVNTDIDEDFICGELNKFLDIGLKTSDIANILPIGKKEACPIRIRITNYHKKKIIFKNCYKLKGTRISIANDLTGEQQTDQKILKKHLVLAKLGGKQNCKIRGSKLIVDDTVFDIEDLRKLEEGEQNEKTIRNSAPPTSSRSTECRKPNNTITEEKKYNHIPKQVTTTPKSQQQNKTSAAVLPKQSSHYRTRSGSSTKN